MYCKVHDCTNEATGATMGPYAHLCGPHTAERRNAKAKPGTYRGSVPIPSSFRPKRRDPRPLRTGVCALDGCEKPVGKIARAEGDGFCSAVCCRAYHDVQFATVNEGAPYSRVATPLGGL